MELERRGWNDDVLPVAAKIMAPIKTTTFLFLEKKKLNFFGFEKQNKKNPISIIILPIIEIMKIKNVRKEAEGLRFNSYILYHNKIIVFWNKK